MSGGLNSHQTRPFSPYRHAPTQEDLLHAALRGAASPHLASERAPSAHSNKQPAHDADVTPTPSRPHTPQSPMSPVELNAEEQRMVADTLAKTPRTSFYAGSVLGSEIVNSHFHDMDLCILLHEVEDQNVHDVVKKALRKAVRQRIKKLGMKYDNEVRSALRAFLLLSFGKSHSLIFSFSLSRSTESRSIIMILKFTFNQTIIPQLWYVLLHQMP